MSTLRTVVLAGASGFMGQHLRARLVADGVHVRTVGRSVDADARWESEDGARTTAIATEWSAVRDEALD